MSESELDRERRLLQEAQAEIAEEAKHLFQESLVAKVDSASSAPGLFARALVRLGFQSKFATADPIAVEKASNLRQP